MPRHLTVLLLAVTIPLAADTTEPTDTQKHSGEITVTGKRVRPPAQEPVGVGKTDTPLRDIPQSIQIVPEKLLAAQGARDVHDSIRNVSGITQSSNNNYGFFNNYLIRGLQQIFLRDGLSDGITVNGYARTLTGVERIEVLKGPGSALFGSTAPGGSVNLVFRSPAAAPAFDAAVGTGSFRQRNATAGITGPLGSPSVLYRLDAGYSHTDGDRRLANTTFEVLPRFTILAGSRDVLTLDLGYHSIDVVADSYGIPYLGTRVLDVSRDNRYDTPFGGTEQTIQRAALRNQFLASPNFSLRTNASYITRDLALLRNGGVAITSTAGAVTRRALRRQNDDVADSLLQIEPVYTTTLGSTRHVFLGGLEWQQHLVTTSRFTAPLQSIANVYAPVIPETSLDGLRFAPDFDRDLRQRQMSLYAQDQIDLSDRWKARIGGRWDRFVTTDFDRVTRVDARRQDSPLSWQVGVVYQPLHSISLFAGVSRGHLAILTTEAANSARAPESGTQIEAGTRITTLGDRLTLSLAAFRVGREDFLVTINGEPQPVGEQQTNGFEADLAGSITPRLQAMANYSFQDATLVRVPVVPPVNGNRPTGVPRHSGSLWLSYELPQGFRAASGATVRSSLFTDQLNTITLPSYVVADAALGWRHGKLDLQVNVRNLTDAAYFRNGTNSGAMPGERRSVSMTARFVH